MIAVHLSTAHPLISHRGHERQGMGSWLALTIPVSIFDIGETMYHHAFISQAEKIAVLQTGLCRASRLLQYAN